MTSKDIAKQYAAKGYPVIWLYGLVQDENGTWVCTCPDPTNPKYKHGKHPMFPSDARYTAEQRALTSHGSKDATTDATIIDTWPDGPMNIGLVGTDTFVITDFDSAPVVAALLDPEFGLRDMATVALSGREGGGLHLYLQCAPTRNGILKLKTGPKGENRLGEVRAKDLYVVAPPSMHQSGKEYSWLGPTLLDDGPTLHTGDAWSFVTDLLQKIGVEIFGKNEVVTLPREGEVEAQPTLPFETSNAMLWSLLSPTYPENDRSTALFRLACELDREIRKQSVDIPRLVRAGIIKEVDRTRQHPRGPKYYHRHNADDYYWDLVVAAEAEVDAETGAPADGQVAIEDISTERFFYTEATGLIDNTNPKRPVTISNFEMRIIEHILVWDDPHADMSKLPVDWMLQFRKGETIVTLRIPAETYKDNRTLLSAIKEAIGGQSEWHIDLPRGVAGLDTVLKVYSGQVPKRVAIGLTGWVGEEDKFLLPGCPAITATGFDENLKFEPSHIAPASLKRGRVFKETTDFPFLFQTLMDVAPGHVIVPILTQLMAAPFVSLGLAKTRSVMHVVGATESFKTSITQSLMGLYGGSEHGPHPATESWQSSTQRAIEVTLGYYRDLPVLVDDFKIGGNGLSSDHAVSLVQSYVDGSPRNKLSRDGRGNSVPVPAGLILSTGEDYWERHRSAVTRSIFIGTDRGISSIEKVKVLSALSTAGDISALGIAWLRWLCNKGQRLMQRALLVGNEKYLSEVRRIVGDDNHRLNASITSLWTISRLMERFFAERFADVPGIWEWMRAGWQNAVNKMKEQAEFAITLSPLDQLLTALREHTRTGRIAFQPRLNGGDWLGTQGLTVVGEVDDEAVHLSEDLTFSWYQEWLQRQGRKPSFGWSQIKSAARSKYGQWATDPMHYKGQGTLRKTRIRLDDFLHSDEEGITTQTPDFVIEEDSPGYLT